MFRLFVLHFFLCCLTLTSYGQSVFVNEINYLDNSTGEGIALAGPADTEINGWSIVFYATDGTVSQTVNLPTKFIPDLDNGHGEIWYDVAMVDENNALALVNNTGAFVHFVSYGALNYTVTASEGIANTVTSTWAGLQITVDNSLQLAGLGNMYDDFAWAVPGGTTPGTINTGQNFDSVLPVVFKDFKVNSLETGNLLTWHTISEWNNDFFIIERSSNGLAFQTIKKIDTQQEKNYTFLDPVSDISLGYYYRLKQVDFNGKTTLSPTIFSQGATSVVSLKPYPNPVTHKLYIELGTNEIETVNIRIYNNNGQLVKTINRQINSAVFDIDVKTLPKGHYTLQFTDNSRSYNGVFIKQ